MNPRACFIIGLPETGKTTYLAALWFCLNQPDKTILRLKKYTGNLRYLAQLSETWLSASKVSRTNIYAEEKALVLTLVDNLQQEYDVTFPDLSGESFQRQYTDREIDKSIAEYIRRCEGILFFVNPLKVVEPHLISKVPTHLKGSGPEPEITSRNPQDDPTDVQLVELLQFISFLRENKPIRLGVIISAWDVVDDTTYNIPEKFLKEQLPLFWQFITSNHAVFNRFYYGVSAQGGALESQEDSDKLLKFEDQVERIIVVDNENNKTNDITLPLWMALNKVGE